MRLRSLLAAGLSTLALAGCAVGPDFKAPTTSTSAAAPFLGAASPAVSWAQPSATWWKLYDDPVLDGLIADALAANTDIRVSVARLERARAMLRGAKADRLPSTSVDASGAYNRVPQVQALPGADRETWLVDGGFSAAYEVDLFGRVRREIEAAHGDVSAASADADAVRIAIVADTVKAYADAASAGQRLVVAQHSVELLDQSIRLTSSRFDVGRASRLDVARISALRQQRAALVPEIAAERQAAFFRLATLTGRAPQDLPATAGARTTTPQLTKPIPIGDGAALIARRPDVRAAERRLAADTARIGVATADLYPRITLGGSVGQTGTGFSNLFGSGPLRFVGGPSISWAFLNQEPARARIAASKADAHASLATFDGVVLRALEDTETALSNYTKALDRRVALKDAEAQAETAVRIVRARQREGQLDFLVVLDAERTYADAQNDLAAADARIADAQVDLFRALAGGWQDAPVASANAQAASSQVLAAAP